MMHGRTVTLKAIETTYNGYRFRSRLEARWAVFFDAVGVRYEYEPEGVQGDGVRYLPDFRIPAWDWWVEIKHGEVGTDDLVKPEKAAREGMRLVVMSGSPWPWDYTVWVGTPAGLVWVPTCQFAECKTCQNLSLVVVSLDGESQRQRVITGCRCEQPLCWPAPADKQMGGYRLEDAYLAARQARFEHGEQPRAPVPVSHPQTSQPRPTQPKLQPVQGQPDWWPEVMAQIGPFMAIYLGKAESVSLEDGKLTIDYGFKDMASYDLVNEPSRKARLEELACRLAKGWITVEVLP